MTARSEVRQPSKVESRHTPEALRLTRERRFVTKRNAMVTNARKQRQSTLSDLEQLVMDYIWREGQSTAEDCREALLDKHPMKDSTVRTVLRRLEEKRFVAHEVDGRAYVYRAVEARHNIAARAVRRIVDRFCGGSLEQLLTGMVESNVLNRKELRRLAQKLGKA
jgi:BlaI family transcriptional regulator, penicillinase repressor